MTYARRFRLCLAGFALWVAGPSLIGLHAHPLGAGRLEFICTLPLAFVAGMRMHNIGRRLLAKAAEPRSNAPPQGDFVLYLRSFQDDEPAAELTWKGGILSPETVEEGTLRILSRFGPVVAVGKPGERLPYLGAARLYFAPEEWQPAVEHMIRTATLIAFRAGSTPGVLWELEAIRRVAAAERVLILLPFAAGGYRDFRRAAKPALRVSLPQWPTGAAAPAGLDIQAAITFAPGWGAELHVLGRVPWPVPKRAAIQEVLARVGNRIRQPYTPALLAARLIVATLRWGAFWVALWPGILFGRWALPHYLLVVKPGG